MLHCPERHNWSGVGAAMPEGLCWSGVGFKAAEMGVSGGVIEDREGTPLI